MEQQRLYLLWTSGNPVTAHTMVLLYATNSLLRDWWDGVTVILWGDSIRLVAEDPGIREKIKIAQRAGVEFSAGSAGSRQLQAEPVLEELGIPRKSWGPALSKLIQENNKILSV